MIRRRSPRVHTVLRPRYAARKHMEIDDLRGMTDEELGTELEDSQLELMNLRFRVTTMQLPNVHEIGKVRRRVARIRTVMRERELARAVT